MPKYKSAEDRGMPLNIYLPQKQIARVHELADHEGVNRSILVSRAIDMLLNSTNIERQAAPVAIGREG